MKGAGTTGDWDVMRGWGRGETAVKENDGARTGVKMAF